MKWKVVLITTVIVLLVVALVLLAAKAYEPQSVNSQASTSDVKNRINGLKLILEEQQLITEIVKLRYEATLIQAKMQPPTPQPKELPNSPK